MAGDNESFTLFSLMFLMCWCWMCGVGKVIVNYCNGRLQRQAAVSGVHAHTYLPYLCTGGTTGTIPRTRKKERNIHTALLLIKTGAITMLCMLPFLKLSFYFLSLRKDQRSLEMREGGGVRERKTKKS